MTAPPASVPAPDVSRFERLLSDLVTRFIGAHAGQLDDEIEAGLGQLCDAFDIDRAVIWQAPEHDPLTLIATYVSERWSDPPVVREEWVPPDRERRVGTDDPLPAVLGLDAAECFPTLLDRVRAGEILLIRRLADVPDDGGHERERLRRIGTEANLTIPFAGSAPGGALGLDMLGRERDWPAPLVERLRLIAQVFAGALARRRVGGALGESDDPLQLVAASAGAGLWDLDVVTGQVWATPTTKVLYGFPPDAVLDGWQLFEHVHPDDRERAKGETVASLSEPTLTTVDHRVVLPDGRVRWVRARFRRHPASSRSHRVAGATVDITELKEAELDVRKSEARLSVALQAAQLGLYETRDGVDSIFIDDRLRAILGAGDSDAPQTIWNHWATHVHEDDRERALDLSRRMRSGALDAGVTEYRYVRPDGRVVWFHHVSRVVERGPDGAAARLIGVIQDVTERKTQELELQRSLDEVQRLQDKLQRENVYLRQEMKAQLGATRIIGTSRAIVRVVEQAAQVASTASTVLLLGETGTGKEQFASLIHDLSPRRGRQMIRVNCSAIPPSLIESELFGREKGAYTGALSKQIGRFELAHGSTLFLDEIGELPTEIQVKLLRVLQEHQIERLGNPRPVPIDVRIIAASNRNLEQATAEGTFRQDLYYRLAVFPITLPPLRERLEDLPLLVEGLVAELAAVMGRRIEAVSRQSLDDLARYDWPGNVRELRNIIERAMILSTGPVLRIDVPRHAAAARPASGTDVPSGPAPGDASSIQTVEREHILRVLQQTGWRIRGPHGAADILKLKPTTLETRMARLGIRRPGKSRPAQ